MRTAARSTFALVMVMVLAGLSHAMMHEVSISGFAFQPADLTVQVGDTVRWTNHDSTPHTVTADDNSYDSGYMPLNATFTHIFGSEGSSPYHCAYHPSMIGTVVAQSPGGGHTEFFHEVSITNFQFVPQQLQISVGDTVLWTNSDGVPHTVTASDQSFDSGNLAAGATFQYVFDAAGDYPYICQYHSNMTGFIQASAPPVLHEVTISNFQFVPQELHIAIGDTVRWTNQDATPHTATATNGEFDSGNLNNGQSFTFVFTIEASVPYVCSYHSNMTGLIVVGNPNQSPSDWVELTSPTSLPLNDVRFWDASVGWAAGDQGILRTTDGGENWTLAGTPEDMEAVHFVSATEGWACGNNGYLVHSTNGGQSWQAQTSGVGDKLRDIWFADAMNGWAVGRNGILIHTTNGGLNWSPQTNPATDDLRGVQMLDAMHGWVVGSGGLILYTSNGGANWVTQLSVPNGEEDEFEAVFAIDANNAWAAGGQGRIYMTTDGGQNWDQTPSGTASPLMDIFFPAMDMGWTCGAAGFLSQWMGDMQMWHVQIAPAVASFNAIYFVSSNLGFMVAGDGRIFKYDNVQTGVEPDPAVAVPERVELYANYPNPFNPTTTIAFELNGASNVKLQVFDVLGQEVGTLIDAPMNAGRHEIQFSADGLSSGLYFYRLQTEGLLLTRRMLLTK